MFDLKRLTVLLLVAATVIGSAGCSKQARIQRNLARADKFYASEDYEKAEIECQKTLKLRPSEPAAIRRLGFIYYAEGRLPAASAFLQKTLEQQPADLEARLKLALTYRALGRAQAAREAALVVLDQQPQNVEALVLLADTSHTAEELSQGEQRLDKVAGASRSSANFFLAQGFLAARRNDLDGAQTAFLKAAATDPKSEAAQRALADLYLARGDRAKAAEAFQTAVALAPIRSRTRLAYAEFQLENGQPEAAKSLALEITRKAPDFSPAWMFLARTALAQRKFEECSAALAKILARDPADFEARMLEGNLMLEKGDAEKAITQFERLVRTFGPSANLEYNLALAQLQNRQDAGALESLSRAVKLDTNHYAAILLLADLDVRHGSLDTAVTLLTQLIQRQPRFLRAYTLLANAFISKKQDDKAAAVYERMIQIWPTELEVCLQAGNGFAHLNRTEAAAIVYNHIANTFTNDPQAGLVAGRNLLTLKRPKDARQVFEHIIQAAGSFMPANEELIELDLREGQPEAALARATKLTQQNPNAPVAWLLLAKVRIAKAVSATAAAKPDANAEKHVTRLADLPVVQQEAQQAETAILKAIDLDPALPASYDMLARLYVSWNKQQQALDRLTALVSKTNHLGAFLQIGMIEEQLQNYPAAAEAYEKALRINPNAAQALSRLASISAEHLNQPDRARQLAEKAASLQPNNPQIADTLGWTAYQGGEYKRALSLFQESVKNQPADPRFLCHLGLAHYMLGDEQSARFELQRASESGQSFPGKDDAVSCLEILQMDPAATDLSPAIAAVEKRLARVPNDSIALLRLAALQERAKAFDKALGTYETALKYDPNTARVRFQLASLLADHLNDPDRALALAKDAHNEAPENVAISRLMGRLLFQKGDIKWAASLFDECARRAPDDPALAYDLGSALYLLGRVEEARTRMQIAAKGEGTQAQKARDFLALIAAAQDTNQLEQASTLIEHTLTADPANVPALIASATLADTHGQHDKAAATYQQVLSRNPDFSPAARELAILTFYHLSQDQKAYELASKARPAFPDDPALARVLGILSYRRAEYPNAARFLKESARKYPNDPELLGYLGLAQYRSSAKAEAKVTLQKASALSLPQNLADEVKRALSELK